MPMHKHPLSHYETMAMLVGGRYDETDHTMMVLCDIPPYDYLYDRYIDPENGELVFINAGSSDWDDRKKVYYYYKYPPEPEADNAGA